MRLLVLAEDFYPEVSGGAHVRWRFSQLAAERGHDVTVFTPRTSETPSEEIVDGVRIIRPFPSKPEGIPDYSPLAIVTRLTFSAALLLYIAWWLQDSGVDAVHATSHAFYWVGSILSVIYSVPYVTFVGYTPTTQVDEQRSPKMLLERINFRFFMGDVAFCRSPSVKNVLERSSSASVSILHGNLNAEKIRSVGSNTDTEALRNELRIPPSNKLIVFVGRFVPIKNPTAVVQILSELPEEYTLVMVGDGPEQEAVAKTADELGVSDRLQLLGERPHQETLSIISSAEALLLSSRAEAYPTVVFEALALNTGVFATPVGILTKISHPMLHCGSIDSLADLIRNSDCIQKNYVDKETLSEYGMERYTNCLLEKIKDGSDNPNRGRTSTEM